jgi:hypothetical protein
MAGASIGWDETDPANSKNLGLGALDIRSLKSAVRTGLDAEHVWPSANGVAGAHRQGSAKVYVGINSALSSDGTVGKLFFSTTNSSLYYLSDTTAARVGGVGTPIVYGPGPGSSLQAANHRQAIEVGVGRTGSLGTEIITFASAFSGLPFVQATVVQSWGLGDDALIATVAYLSAASMTIAVFDSSGAVASSKSFHFISIGSQHHAAVLP